MSTPNTGPEKSLKRTWHAPNGFILRGQVTHMPAQAPECKPYAPVEYWWSDAAHITDWDPHGPS